MPIYKTKGTVVVPVSNEINASNEAEAFNIFQEQLCEITDNLNSYLTEHNFEEVESQHIIEHIEVLKTTYTSLKSLQEKVNTSYTSLKDLYNK